MVSGAGGIQRPAQRRLQMNKAIWSASPAGKKRLLLTHKSSQRLAGTPGSMPWHRDALCGGKKKQHMRDGSGPAEPSPPVPVPSCKREQCCHFWVIDLVEGPTSHGVCKWCDEQRQFSNYLRLSGILPEKDISSLSHGPGILDGSLDTVLQKETGGAVVATAARRPAKAWTHPKRGDQWVRRRRSV